MHKNSGRSLAVRVGALTAALSLMLAGGVAMASSASASSTTDKNTAPGQQSAGPGGTTVPEKNGNPSHGDNGGQPSNSNGEKGQSDNGLNADGGQGHYAVTICHATRSNSNPYVVITVDASSISELMDTLLKKGNGHGDHVGDVFSGQKSGTNWGDIIPVVYYPGTTDVAFPGINADHADWIARGCAAPVTPASLCVKSTGGSETFPGGVESEAYKSALASGLYSTSTPCGPVAQLCVTATGLAQDFPDGVDSEAYKTALADTAAYSATFPCKGGDSFIGSASVTHSFCAVNGGEYKVDSRTSTKTGYVSSVSQADADQLALNAANAELLDLLKAQALSSPDDIIPSYLDWTGNNWSENSVGRSIWANNCVLEDGQTVASASAVLPGTIAPAAGKPAPAKTPTKATLPASVPAGDGSSFPGLPLWALAMVVAGAIGAAAAGKTLVSNRK